jgi:HEAT repeat protein
MRETLMPKEENIDTDEAVQTAIKNLESKEFKVRNETIKYLGKLKNPKAKNKLYELMELTTFDSRLRITAIDSLGKGDKDNRFLQALEKLANDTTQDKEIRRSCITQLSYYRDQRLINWAVRGLIKIGEPRASVALIPALGDEDEEIRKDVQRHLENEAPKIIKDLIVAFSDPKSNKLARSAIAGYLGRINTPETDAALIGALNDGNERIVMIAIRGLSKSKSVKAIEPLIKISKDGDKKKRLVEDALFQLGQDNLAAVIKTIVPYLIDKTVAYKAVAEEVIQKLSPQCNSIVEALLKDESIAEEIKGALKKVQKKISAE